MSERPLGGYTKYTIIYSISERPLGGYSKNTTKYSMSERSPENFRNIFWDFAQIYKCRLDKLTQNGLRYPQSKTYNNVSYCFFSVFFPVITWFFSLALILIKMMMVVVMMMVTMTMMTEIIMMLYYDWI